MLTYAILLLILGILLVIMEVLIPSGGIISIFAAAALIGSLVLAFKQGNTAGLVFVAMELICLPVAVVYSFKLLPKTAIGKQLILKPSVASKEERGDAGVSEEDYSDWIGKTGITVTPLRPSGIAEIDHERLSVVSQGEVIDENVEIVVTEIEGNSIVVEPKETA